MGVERVVEFILIVGVSRLFRSLDYCNHESRVAFEKTEMMRSESCFEPEMLLTNCLLTRSPKQPFRHLETEFWMNSQFLSSDHSSVIGVNEIRRCFSTPMTSRPASTACLYAAQLI